jgi:hypothetical protein
MAPEQQRQEENGDAAALPHTYRKDRQRDFRRVRKIFRFTAPRCCHSSAVGSDALLDGLCGHVAARSSATQNAKRDGIAAVPFGVSLFPAFQPERIEAA